MNNYDYNTLSGLRAAMVELKTAAAAAGLEVACWYDYGYDNFHISVYSRKQDPAALKYAPAFSPYRLNFFHIAV